MNYVLVYTVIGAVGAALFHIMQCLESGGMNPEAFIKCVAAGAIGGLIPGAIRQVTRSLIPVVQSWLMLIIIIFGINLFSVKVANLYWTAFVYGYMTHLLWEAYHHSLPKV